MAFPIAARFAHPGNGYKGDQDQAAKYLTPGKVYTLTGINVGRSSSRLLLDIPDGPAFGFNTVMFDPASVFDQDDEDIEPKPAPDPADVLSLRFFHLASELENDAASNDCACESKSLLDAAARIRKALDTDQP
jgi:hypothetical protein